MGHHFENFHPIISHQIIRQNYQKSVVEFHKTFNQSSITPYENGRTLIMKQAAHLTVTQCITIIKIVFIQSLSFSHGRFSLYRKILLYHFV